MTATLNQDLPQAIDDFFSRDIPEPFQVLGLKLLPLSIGRYRRMARHGIAFVSESASKPTGADLILGALICSMQCEEWDELSTSGELPEIVNGWLRKIRAVPPWYLRGKLGAFVSATWIGKLWRKRNSFDLLEKMKLFDAYVKDAQKVPQILRRGNDVSGACAAHWSQNLETVLLSDLNWNLRDIEEQPLSKAIAMYYRHAENNGTIRIITDKDVADAKKTEERFAIAMEQFKGNGGVL